MRATRLARWLCAYTTLLCLACLGARRFSSLEAAGPYPTVVSAWKGGKLVAREVTGERPPVSNLGDSPSPPASLDRPGVTRVDETVVGEGAILTWPGLVFSLSLASGHDGLVATLRGERAYVTASDLLARQAYERGVSFGGGVRVGADVEVIWALLSERLHATVDDVRGHARLRRARFVRSVHGERPPGSDVVPDALSSSVVRAAMLDAARYLTRGVSEDGHFRYLVEATTNQTLPEYDWTRHAGAAYFLAQAAAASPEPDIKAACLRAVGLLTTAALGDCGDAPCIGKDRLVDLGSTALAVLALAEVVRTGLDPRYAALVAGLARFLRASQRPDGEFMHEYDTVVRRPVDVQYLYYSGEAAFALARAHRVTHDAADLEAAQRGLAHLTTAAWSFFGDRYYFGEEHWTCQAMAELWDEAPDEHALDFCVRWQRYGRRMQYGPGETPYDADGAFGVGPLMVPRLTPVASRTEAGVATLDVLRRAGMRGEARSLEAQLRRSIALLIRRQLRPGPMELFADANAIHGAMPNSEVDLQLRIDYAQHAGSAMVRWLGLGE